MNTQSMIARIAICVTVVLVAAIFAGVRLTEQSYDRHLEQKRDEVYKTCLNRADRLEKAGRTGRADDIAFIYNDCWGLAGKAYFDEDY